jgi:hypothetical protein
MLGVKRRTYVASAEPNHLARLGALEIIQGHLEGRRNNIAVIQSKPHAGFADVAQGAGQYTAYVAGEDQRSVRRRQPVNLPSFCHCGLRTDKERRWRKWPLIALPNATLTTV